MTALGGMFALAFIQHALLAGTAIAALSGLVGYFVVLRGQVFAGDAVSHVAYVGALAALAAGVDLQLGLYTATIAAGVALGLLGGRASADDVIIGTAFSWILGLGVFFLSVFTTHTATANSSANVTVLFGSLFGVSPSDAVTSAIIAAVLIMVVLAIGRPLLFASIDPAVAAARGLPVRLLDILFLGVVGATAAEASRAVGALLLLGLLAAPAAAAQRLTNRPWAGLALSSGLAVATIWIGITVSFLAPALPPSFTIMAAAAAEHAIAALVTRLRTHERPEDRPPHHATAPQLTPPAPRATLG